MPGGAYTDAEIRNALYYSEIAGGDGYHYASGGAQTFTAGDTRVADVVRTKGEFLTAIQRTGPRVVFIPSDVSIDLSGETFRVRDTVIASDRGVNGSSGALLYNNTRGLNSTAMNGGISGGLMHLHGRSALLGVRYRGAAHNNWSNSDHPGYIPYPEGDSSARRKVYNANHARGVKVHDSNVEIANCEIYGWATAAIQMGSSSSSASPEIHHNHIHDNMMTSAGYCIDIYRGRPWIHHNYFNAFRHAIDGFGFSDCSYIVEDNVFGPSQASHAVDQHGLHNNLSTARTNGTRSSSMWHGQAGGSMVVRRNTFVATNVISDANFDRGLPTWAVSVRGEPWPRSGSNPGILIEHNRFPHKRVERNGTGNGIRDWDHGGPYNQQVRGSGFTVSFGSDGFSRNYVHRDNQFNAPNTDYVEGYGAPIDLEDPPTQFDIPTPPVRGMPRERGKSLTEIISAGQPSRQEIN